MFDALVKAIAQMGTPPFRRILLKAVGLALLLIVLIGISLQRVFSWLATTGAGWAEVTTGVAPHAAWDVEREHYPAEPFGRALPLGRATLEGSKTALLALLVYLVALPFLLFAGLGVFIFFFATAYLLGREYFELVAMRFMPPTDAKALRRLHRGTVFMAGLAMAAFVSIPIVNLATPLFATALAVHVYKRLAGPRIELIEPKRA